MLLRELFEAEQSVGIIFGRFNPPHQGHKAAWQEAAKNTHWYVGTNQSTQGPKDPLPFEIKIQAMETIWPEIKGHIIPEQTWWSLAAAVYKKHGEIDLKVITDETDAKVFVPGLQKQNGVDGRHGFYKFKSIEWQPAPRVSSATELRAAVANDDPKAFAKAAGVPSDTKVAGESFFELVKKYLGQYNK
jgi:nicotinamide mononucleotide adenylyltransferase